MNSLFFLYTKIFVRIVTLQKRIYGQLELCFISYYLEILHSLLYQLMNRYSPSKKPQVIFITEIVENQLGSKLKVPKNINNISQDAEDLLKKLLQMDPNDRITWNDFFNHKVFSGMQKDDKSDAKNAVGQFLGNF